jgi:O-antigen/teichoic acid export membrane protein
VRQTIQRMAGHFAGNGMAQGALGAFVLKVAGSFLNIVMFTIAARATEPAEFGLFAMWFNAVSFLAAIALCGQETLIVRSWSEYIQQSRFDLARGAIGFGIGVCMMAALLAAAGLVTVSLVAGWRTPSGLITAAWFFLIAQTLAWFTANTARTIVGFPFGEGLRETWRIAVIVGTAVLAFTGAHITVTELFLLCVGGMGLLALVQWIGIWRNLPREVRAAPPARDPRAWTKRSLPMWAAALLDAASQYLDVILLGLLLSPAAAGGYFVAARLANVFAMIAGGMANYSASPIASMFFRGQRPELQRSLRAVSLTVAILVAAGLLVIFLGGDVLLTIFGKSYADQHAILFVLSTGTAVAALGGPAMYVLLLTGHEALYSRVVVASLIARCIALAVFVPIYGAMAAAAAWCLCLIATTVALNVVCRRLVGIDPSVMALLDRPPAAADTARLAGGREATVNSQ